MKKNNSQGRVGNRKHIEIFFFLMLTFIVLVSCIDPASRQFLSVEEVVVFNGTPYLLVEEKMSWGPGCCEPTISHVYSGSGFAENWQLLNEVDNEILDEFDGDHNLPKSDCYSKNKAICFRVSVNENIDYSVDGGESWELDWRIPVGRERYMNGYIGITGSDYVDISIMPRDIAIMDSGKSFIVIVPCGIQGLLLKRGNGEWERIEIRSVDEGVLPAVPLPFKATSFSDLYSSVGWEYELTVYSVAILAIVLYFRGRKIIKTNISNQEELYNNSMDYLLLLTLGYSALIVILAWTVFTLWGLGIIPFYEVSVITSLVALVFFIANWNNRIKKRVINQSIEVEKEDA